MRSTDQAVAVAAADLHFTLAPPLCRNVPGVDWIEVQGDYLDQLKRISDAYGKAPIILAGDIFNEPNPPAELVNWLIRRLRGFDRMIYAVPGNHELPCHRYADKDKSAYTTLVRAGVIYDLVPNEPQFIGKDAVLYGFPWGVPVTHKADTNGLAVAVVHDYCWAGPKPFPGVDEQKHVTHWRNRLTDSGYDIGIFGDNHTPFDSGTHHPKGRAGASALNCGCFIRRRKDEYPIAPRVGILWRDGSCSSASLDTRNDKFADAPDEAAPATPFDAADVLAELAKLGDASISFGEAVRRFMDTNKTKPLTRDMVVQALKGGK